MFPCACSIPVIIGATKVFYVAGSSWGCYSNIADFMVFTGGIVYTTCSFYRSDLLKSNFCTTNLFEVQVSC
jgi:hypothetical protein